MSRERQEPELVDRTIDVWHAYSGQPLNAEDAREIVDNVAGFFTLISKWDAEREEHRRHDPDDERGRDSRTEWE